MDDMISVDEMDVLNEDVEKSSFAEQESIKQSSKAVINRNKSRSARPPKGPPKNRSSMVIKGRFDSQTGLGS